MHSGHLTPVKNPNKFKPNNLMKYDCQKGKQKIQQLVDISWIWEKRSKK